MRRALSALALLALVVGGCARDGAGFAPDELPGLVLQPADVPRGFFRFDEGRLAAADMPPGDRADAGRFGREGGWKARYRRNASSATRGPLVIESRVDVFEDADGARRDFDALEAELRATAQLLAAPQLGEEAAAARVEQASLEPVETFVVAWRESNAVAALTVNGFAAGLDVADAVALARRQQERLAAAREE